MLIYISQNETLQTTLTIWIKHNDVIYALNPPETPADCDWLQLSTIPYKGSIYKNVGA